MNTKILNLMDAFRLASIVSKYVDTTNLSTDAVEFIQGIVEKISPQEYLTCVSMITEENEEKIIKNNSLDILATFIEGLKANQVVSLVAFYKSFGL